MSAEETFVAGIAARVARMDGPRNRQKDPIVDDPTIIEWALQACSMAELYCERPFVVGTFVDRYPQPVPERLKLRVTPVSSVTSVRIIGEDSDLVSGTDYSQDRDCIVFENGGLDDLDVRVTYVGGYTLSTENSRLLAILSQQTLIWYRQKAIMGLSQFNTKAGTVKAVSNEVELSKGVKNSLSSFRYPGPGYPE